VVGDSGRRRPHGCGWWRSRLLPSRGRAAGGILAAVDDLTKGVERAAATEKSALSSKWKNELDVQSLIRRTRRIGEEQRQAVRLDTDPDQLSPRWAGLRQRTTRPRSPTSAAGRELSAQERPDDGDADGDGDGDGATMRLRLS
jgi:hypothetical protein